MSQIEALAASQNVVNDPYSGSETELDRSYNALSEFVCAEGPLLLTRGMAALEANHALMECLKKLKRERDEARGC